MKEKILGIMIPLGHDKHVLSDTIIAVEPLDSIGQYWKTDGNGTKLRSRVLINHAEGEILASRTATTILKSMTKLDESVGNSMQAVANNFRKLSERLKSDKSEKSLIENALITSPTVKWALTKLPFGETKFYKLVKKYHIDVKYYLEATENSDMLKDKQDDGLA